MIAKEYLWILNIPSYGLEVYKKSRLIDTEMKKKPICSIDLESVQVKGTINIGGV